MNRIHKIGAIMTVIFLMIVVVMSILANVAHSAEPICKIKPGTYVAANSLFLMTLNKRSEQSIKNMIAARALMVIDKNGSVPVTPIEYSPSGKYVKVTYNNGSAWTTDEGLVCQ